MSNQLPLATGTVLQQRYLLHSPLGEGGFGRVYRATDNRMDCDVAVKEFVYEGEDKEIWLATFKREAKLLRNLDHSALPKSSDFFTEDERCFLVMDFVEGDDLATLIKARRKPFDITTILDWAEQILDALEYLHHDGIVHRDIKPINIKVTTGGKIKLLDLGIAKGAIGLDQLVRFNPETQGLLNMHFADRVSELLNQKTDGRSDIYSIGATLYELATTHRPIPANVRAFGDWTGKPQVPPGLHDVHPGLLPIIERSWAIDANARYPTASKMRSEIGQLKLHLRASKPKTLDEAFHDGDIDLYEYVTTKYPSVASPRFAEINAEPTLLEKFAEEVRRAELLGFTDLLQELKEEQFTITKESVLKLERLVNTEIKIEREIERIEREIERKEVEQRWAEARSRRAEVNAEEQAQRHADFSADAIVREKGRVSLLAKIVAAVIGVGLIVAYFLANLGSGLSPATSNQLTKPSPTSNARRR